MPSGGRRCQLSSVHSEDSAVTHRDFVRYSAASESSVVIKYMHILRSRNTHETRLCIDGLTKMSKTTKRSRFQMWLELPTQCTADASNLGTLEQGRMTSGLGPRPPWAPKNRVQGERESRRPGCGAANGKHSFGLASPGDVICTNRNASLPVT